MKFKYPKSIKIGNTKFKVKYRYDENVGARIRYPTKERKAYIEFDMGVHKKNPEQFLGLLIHELKEVIQIEQSTRMWKRGNDNYMFVYDHSEHDDLCNRLAGALSKFIK